MQTSTFFKMAVVWFLINSTCYAAAPEIIATPLPGELPQSPPFNSTVVKRQRMARLSIDAFGSEKQSTLTLTLFEDIRITVVRRRVHQGPDAAFWWYGTIAGEEGAAVIFTITSEGAAAIIDTHATRYKIRPINPPIHLIREIDLRAEKTVTISSSLHRNLTAMASGNEIDVFELTNQQRQEEGLTILSWSEALFNAAESHSLDMAARNYFSHTGLDGRSPCERITATGYSWQACGENIAAGYIDPQELVLSWMGSSGHRANILNPDFCDVGIGYAYSDSSDSTYHHYWTQNFGRLQEVETCSGNSNPPVSATDTNASDSSQETSASEDEDKDGSGCFIQGMRVYTLPGILRIR